MGMLLSAGWASRHALDRWRGPVVRRFLARPFSNAARRRVVIYFSPNRISFAQTYPFLRYQSELAGRFDAEIRCVEIDSLLDGGPIRHGQADIVLVQPWFTVDASQLRKALDRLRKSNPMVEISFLDSYAHNDLRLGRVLEPDLRYYLKKSLFRDRSLYLRPRHGETNLTEFYGDLYGLSGSEIDWETPTSLLDKLHLSPNFFTAPHLMPVFSGPCLSASPPRKVDIHARLGRQGSGWYEAMRRDGLARLESLTDLAILSKGSVPLKQYLAELGSSRLCFSPFGYGELCWRDIEAFGAGAVLIKPDMSHLETLPDLYEAGVTYLPVAWDFSNLEEVVRHALANPEMCSRIATEAWSRISDYLKYKRFISDTAFLFEPADAA